MKIKWPDLELPPINLWVVHRLYIPEDNYLPYKDPEKRKAYGRAYSKKYAEELNIYRRAYAKENPEKEKEWQDKYKAHTEEQRRAYHIMSKYGLSMETLSMMLYEQENKCAICERPFIKTPHVDHDHITGKVRGLLCGPCNTGLGVYEKKEALFKLYLERTSNG